MKCGRTWPDVVSVSVAEEKWLTRIVASWLWYSFYTGTFTVKVLVTSVEVKTQTQKPTR